MKHVQSNLPFILKGKPLLFNKGTESMNSLCLLPILAITLPTTPHLGISHQDNKTFPQFQEIGHLILCLKTHLQCLFADLLMSDVTFKTVILYQFTFNTTASLMHHPLQKWQRMELIPPPFLNTAEVNFLVFPLMIIIFVFLTFTLAHFDPSTPFQASFGQSRDSLINFKSSA